MAITWKKDTLFGTDFVAMYTGDDGSKRGYSVITRSTKYGRWEVWSAGRYVGKFKTLKAAKAASGIGEAV